LTLLHSQTEIDTDTDPSRSLTERYLAVRNTTEALAAPLSGEDQVVQSMPNASPTKWHRGHTTWFFETFLLPHLDGYELYDDRYSYLFNSYYEAVGERHARHQRGLLTRPSADEVADFRRHVDEHMVTLIESDNPALRELVELGLHHEQQHQELLLMDIKHAFSINPLQPAYSDGEHRPTPAGALTWRSYAGGLVDIGHDGSGFAFDNEGPRHQAFLQPFEVAETPVTNGEWIAFIEAGGYETVGLWLSEGWANCVDAGWKHPAYWSVDNDGQWHIFTLAGTKPVDPNEPVSHVSYMEADAFARWAGARLPTEFEWEHAAAQDPVVGNFMSSGRFHPGGPVEAANRLFGDTWEWTSSPYIAYPGFTIAEGAVGEYNGKFMVNQQVLRGGCAFTPADHTRATYRNFFPTSTRWHCSGVRLARG